MIASLKCSVHFTRRFQLIVCVYSPAHLTGLCHATLLNEDPHKGCRERPPSASHIRVGAGKRRRRRAVMRQVPLHFTVLTR